MKKQFTLASLFFFACFTGFAQSVTITPDSPRMIVKGSAAQQGLDLSTSDQYLNARVLQNTNSGSDKDMYLGYQSGATSSLHLYSNNLETLTIKDARVGIRMTAPNAPLQFENTTVPRKIVLYEQVNNDHQWVGFGNTVGEFRYQTNRPETGHVFYSGINATSSLELMRITGTGNVGIGTSTPHAPLQLSNGISNRKFVLYEGANNDHQFFGLGINNGILRYQINNTGDNHVFYAGANATTSNELMRITGIGNVGIGTASPNAPLQFANSLVNRKVVLYEDANNDHQFNGFGVNPFILRYQVAATTSSHIFYAGANATTSNELMRITGTGNVGIGTTSPDNKLDVLGTIRANEVIIESGWADYVFDEGFKLKTLTEVETFIKENKHLPDVPSAKEVQKNGAHVSDLMTKMMQKIEELTLYSIEQQKKIEALEKRLNEKR